MEYSAFFHAGRRHQVNWIGSGYYMVVDNGDAVAVWPANWGYLARNEAKFFYADDLDSVWIMIALGYAQPFAEHLAETADCLALPATTDGGLVPISQVVEQALSDMQLHYTCKTPAEVNSGERVAIENLPPV